MVLLFQIFSLLFSVLLFLTYIIYCFCKIFYEMDPCDAKFMRTERKPGTLDVHPNLNAIVLNYEITVQILNGKENILYGEQKNAKKNIELPMLNSRTDCLALAKDVVNSCDLIHHSRIPEVEQTIYYLKKRKLSRTASRENDKNGKLSPSQNNEEPNYNNLLDYIELLYEGMTEKIKGAHLIQLLARDPDNLEAMSKNETVISALGRVLREDWKRSIVLSTHLVFTFFCFSMYTCFHEVILKCKVGSICMDIIDYELRRYDKWRADLEGVAAPSDIPIVKKPCPSSASMTEINRSRIPEPVRPKSGNFSDANLKSAMEGSVYDDLTNSTESIDDKKLTEAERAKRFRTLVKKQEHLLRVAFYLLLNISEDESIEEKMTKRNIVGLLVKSLERNNDELLILVVTFLKKLSIMMCNKDNMASLNIIEKLPNMLDSSSPDLVHLTLKLLFNLSFDNKLRYKMIRCGLLPKFVSLLSDDRHQEIVYKLLYQLSYDEDARNNLTDYVGLITDMLLLNAGNESDEVMVALCVNLALEPNNAQQMVKKSRLQSLMTRAFNFQDVTLMKALRNISDHKPIRANFVEFVGDIAKAVVESKDEDFVRECIGILGNLNLSELDWAEIFKHFKMTEWIQQKIQNNNTDPELVLQVIILLGTAVMDEGCANLICETDVLSALIDLLKNYQEDDEIVLQIIYVFYVCLSHKEVIGYIIHKTDAAAYLIDLLQDNNPEIRKICNKCLYVISDHDNDWSNRIRTEKFRQHNTQWLQMINSHQFDREDEEDNDNDELPPYLNTEYLGTAEVPPLYDLADTQDRESPSEKDLEGEYFDKLELIQDYEIEAM